MVVIFPIVGFIYVGIYAYYECKYLFYTHSFSHKFGIGLDGGTAKVN